MVKIRISTEIRYIEGNRYSAFIVKDEEYIPICAFEKEKSIVIEKVKIMKEALQKSGIDVEIENKVWEDPNFESYEEAMEYLANKGE